MSQRVFHELASVEEAKRLLEKHLRAELLGVVEVPLEEALGRVLAEDVEAEIDVPPFDRASMDGYAVRAEDTFGAEEDRPITLRVVGKIGAGDSPNVAVEDGEAVEISTGAPIPKGANAVVMVEYTWLKDGLKVYRAVSPGENIMAAGADIMAGELVLRRGSLLTPRETGVLAALGRRSVKVYRKPKVAVISTGNEVVPPGSPLPYGKIYDINSRTISDSVVEDGGEPIFLGIVGDSFDEMRSKILEALRDADVVITSGGTSAGVGDLLYKVVDGLGPPGIIVHGVAVRPGKPTVIAVSRGKPVIGLPGYPASALMIYSILVRPLIRRLGGLSPESRGRLLEARVAERFPASGGRREYVPVILVRAENEEYFAYPLPGESGAITTLAEADGFVEIPEGKLFLEAGEPVSVELFGQSLRPPDLTIIGSHCVGIDILLRIAREGGSPLMAKVIATGSSGGFVAVRRGVADIAGTHLLDEETGLYNLPFLERFNVADKAVLVRGYRREQGILVAKGNPKGIRGLEDLLREDVTIINRNPGSGTRMLLDMRLRAIAEARRMNPEELARRVRGYRTEAKSHSAVAVAVLQGKADAGLAIRAVAELYGLGFIPVAYEEYDFLIRRERYAKPSVQTFLKALRSEGFRRELPARAPGLSCSEDTGRVLHPPSQSSPSC
jgi:putative molybdopterin biosynthesis protein